MRAFVSSLTSYLRLQALYDAVDLWAVGTFCGEADVSAVATTSICVFILLGICLSIVMLYTTSKIAVIMNALQKYHFGFTIRHNYSHRWVIICYTNIESLHFIKTLALLILQLFR